MNKQETFLVTICSNCMQQKVIHSYKDVPWEENASRTTRVYYCKECAEKEEEDGK